MGQGEGALVSVGRGGNPLDGRDAGELRDELLNREIVSTGLPPEKWSSLRYGSEP